MVEEEEEEEGGFIRLDSGSRYPDPEDALIGVDKEHAISALAMMIDECAKSAKTEEKNIKI